MGELDARPRRVFASASRSLLKRGRRWRADEVDARCSHSLIMRPTAASTTSATPRPPLSAFSRPPFRVPCRTPASTPGSTTRARALAAGPMAGDPHGSSAGQPAAEGQQQQPQAGEQASPPARPPADGATATTAVAGDALLEATLVSRRGATNHTDRPNAAQLWPRRRTCSSRNQTKSKTRKTQPPPIKPPVVGPGVLEDAALGELGVREAFARAAREAAAGRARRREGDEDEDEVEAGEESGEKVTPQ